VAGAARRSAYGTASSGQRYARTDSIDRKKPPLPSLATRVTDLYNSLNEFKASDHPGAPTADMFDAIVKMAQAELTDDPIIAAVKPTTRDVTGGVGESAGDMRATLNQVLSALGESGPSIA